MSKPSLFKAQVFDVFFKLTIILWVLFVEVVIIENLLNWHHYGIILAHLITLEPININKIVSDNTSYAVLFYLFSALGLTMVTGKLIPWIREWNLHIGALEEEQNPSLNWPRFHLTDEQVQKARYTKCSNCYEHIIQCRCDSPNWPFL
jgi:hypothetical protein